MIYIPEQYSRRLPCHIYAHISTTNTWKVICWEFSFDDNNGLIMIMIIDSMMNCAA